MMRLGIFDWVEHSETQTPAEVFAGRLALAEAADRLGGFHAYFVAEHQGTPLSINAEPALLLAAMAERTRRLRLGALTFCLPWYDPYRFYHQVCMLDQLSGGRLELGVGRGTSPIEALVFGLDTVEASRERYRETIDFFFEACRTDVVRHRGREVPLYVKPAQRPWPPLWFPSSNPDSIAFTARHGYHTATIASPAETKARFTRYRELWERHGHEPGRHNAHVAEPFLARTQHLVVLEDEKAAVDAGLSAYEAWTGHMHHLTRKHGRPDVLPLDPYAESSPMRLIAGTPSTVVERLRNVIRETGLNYLLCVFSFGSLPHELALRSLQLFASDVLPQLKER